MRYENLLALKLHMLIICAYMVSYLVICRSIVFGGTNDCECLKPARENGLTLAKHNNSDGAFGPGKKVKTVDKLH